MENTTIENTTDVIEDINEETLLSLDENLELDQEQTEIAEAKCKKEGEDMEDESDEESSCDSEEGESEKEDDDDEEEEMTEAKVTEAEVSSDEEFMEYAKEVLKAAHGDKYDEEIAMKTAQGILDKAKGDYGVAIGMLTSGLGEEMNEKLKVTKVSDDEYEYEISGGIKSWQTGAENPNDVRPFVKTIISDIQKFSSDHEYVAFLEALMKYVNKESADRDYMSWRREALKDLSKSLSKASVSFESKIDDKQSNYNVKPNIAKISAKISQIAAGEYHFTVFLSELVKHLKTMSDKSTEYNQLYKDIDKASKMFYKDIMEDTQEEMKEETTEIAVDSSDISRLVESEEGLTTEFKEKATTIFEAAVKSKIKETEETLKESYAVALIEEVETIKEELVDKIDNYLTYAVESWAADNAVAIESGLRTEIAENFIQSLKTVFVENYIEVPEAKKDLVAEMESTIAKLQEEAADTTQSISTLSEQVERLTREKIVAEAAVDLADTQVEKLKSLVEDVNYTSESAYRKKVETIKEFYLKGILEETETLVEQTTDESSYVTTETIIENETIAEETVSPAMQKYLTALSRLNKANEATVPVR